MSEIEFKEKFIGFVDILGFKQLVEKAERGIGITLQELLELVKELGTPEDRREVEKYGPTICPGSKYLQRDLDFRLTQISDCVIGNRSPGGAMISLAARVSGAP